MHYSAAIVQSEQPFYSRPLRTRLAPPPPLLLVAFVTLTRSAPAALQWREGVWEWENVCVGGGAVRNVVGTVCAQGGNARQRRSAPLSNAPAVAARAHALGTGAAAHVAVFYAAAPLPATRGSGCRWCLPGDGLWPIARHLAQRTTAAACRSCWLRAHNCNCLALARHCRGAKIHSAAGGAAAAARAAAGAVAAAPAAATAAATAAVAAAAAAAFPLLAPRCRCRLENASGLWGGQASCASALPRAKD